MQVVQCFGKTIETYLVGTWIWGKASVDEEPMILQCINKELKTKLRKKLKQVIHFSHIQTKHRKSIDQKPICKFEIEYWLISEEVWNKRNSLPLYQM